LDFVIVIWIFLVLDLHEFWLYKIKDMAGVNWNLLQLTGGKPKFAQNYKGVNLYFIKLQGVKFSMKVQNQKSLQLTRMKFKKKKFTGEKTENDIYYRRIKHYINPKKNHFVMSIYLFSIKLIFSFSFHISILNPKHGWLTHPMVNRHFTCLSQRWIL